MAGGRFNPQGSFGALYLASDHATALREVGAVFEIPGKPPVVVPSNPQTVVTILGKLEGVLDLTDPAVQVALGTSVQELTGSWIYEQSIGDTPPTHRVGREAYNSGRIRALLNFSAKNVVGGTVVAVFPDRLVDGEPSHLQINDEHGNLTQRIP
jgi:RES domain-containing protein